MKGLKKNELPKAEIHLDKGDSYLEIFYSSPAANVLSEFDSGKIIAVNESWENFAGFKRDEVIGKTSVELNIVTQSYLEELYTSLNESDLLKSHKIQIRRKSGEKAFGLATFQLLEQDGNSVILSSIVDITDLVKTKRELKLVTKFSDCLLASVYEAVFILDKFGTCVRVNRAFTKLTGYTENDILGEKAPFPHWPPEEYENIQNYISNYLKGKFTRGQLTFKRANGERFEVLLTTTEILNEKN